MNGTVENNLFIDGTESLMFIEFCRMHNCTLEISLGRLHFRYRKFAQHYLPINFVIINSDEAGEWGQIFDNFTGDGVIGAVAERRADIGVTALYLW